MSSLILEVVVLLGYAPNFKRNNRWRNQAQYERQRGDICRFKYTNDEPGEYETALVRVRGFILDQYVAAALTCCVCYAWGKKEHEKQTHFMADPFFWAPPPS